MEFLNTPYMSGLMFFLFTVGVLWGIEIKIDKAREEIKALKEDNEALRKTMQKLIYELEYNRSH